MCLKTVTSPFFMFVQHGYNSESRQMKRGLRETSIIFSQLGKYFFQLENLSGPDFYFFTTSFLNVTQSGADG